MNFHFITNTPLFSGISEEEAKEVLNYLGADQRSFIKNEMIYRMGETTEEMGVLLAGSVSIESDDVWGNRHILDQLVPGQVFAETYACLSGEPLMVNVIAVEPSEILFLNVSRLIAAVPGSCPCHTRLIQNLLSISAGKNLILSRRIFHTSPKTIRERLLSYLSEQSLRHKSRRFSIPFDRQGLADYLNVDRSALSGELGKMRRDGLIDFHKNFFELKT